jgi:glycosyltransferase involved in cell wall biosynthesis
MPASSDAPILLAPESIREPTREQRAHTPTAPSLRIALVTEYYYPHLGGICEHVHFLAREARRRGHHVDIITSQIPGAGRGTDPHVLRIGRSQSVYANGSQARITVGMGLRRRLRRALRLR